MSVNTNLNKNILAVCFFLLLIISASNVVFTYYTENFRPEKLIKLDEKYEHKLFAYISGAVVNPGVYEVDQDTKLIDLIYAAGGYDENIDPQFLNENLNLSQKIFNEDHIYIPYRSASELKADQSTNENTNNNSSKISLNSATSDELDTLPGVGEATIRKIIDARPYESIDELRSVEGIGEKRFNDLKNLVTL
jgi:competence protein ComEA